MSSLASGRTTGLGSVLEEAPVEEGSSLDMIFFFLPSVPRWSPSLFGGASRLCFVLGEAGFLWYLSRESCLVRGRELRGSARSRESDRRASLVFLEVPISSILAERSRERDRDGRACV